MLCALLPTATAWGSEVRVFTDRQHPIAGTPGTRVTELDASAHLDAALTDRLPVDPTRAAAIVRQRLLEYRVVGVCYWLFCTTFGCSVRTSGRPQSLS